MKSFLKITSVVAMTSLVLWAGSISTQATGDDSAVEITEDGAVIHTGENSELDDVVEGSLSFIVNVPFSKVAASFQKEGTLGAIGGENIKEYTVQKEETADHVVYKTVQKIVPFKVAGVDMFESTVGINYFVNKRALSENIIFVKFELDPANKGKWERMSGRIYAVDLNDGHTQVMLTTSSKSGFNLPSFGTRQTLVSKYLKKQRSNILKWVDSL